MYSLRQHSYPHLCFRQSNHPNYYPLWMLMITNPLNFCIIEKVMMNGINVYIVEEKVGKEFEFIQ